MSDKQSSSKLAEIEIEDDRAITDTLQGEVQLQDLLVKPDFPLNALDLAEALMRLINVNGLSASKSSIGRHLVDPGKVGLINHNGRVQLVGPGRWMVPNPRATWVGIYELQENLIKYESLCICRVPKGTYGLAVDNGVSIILAEGVHVRNSRFFELKEFVNSNQKYIHHGTIHLLIVPVGEYALVVEHNVPRILKTGTYVTDSNFFTVNPDFVSVNQEHIQHGTIHIIRVLKGKIALITNNVKPMLLHEGTKTFTSQVLTFHGTRDVNESHVVHGTITRYRVRNGEIGLIWEDNQPIFIDKPGIYEVDSPNFVFEKCVSSSDKQIQLGSRKRIVVYDGEVGISYVNGKLDILPPKEHIFDAAQRVFVNFLSTRQQSIPLGEGNASTGHFLRCDTKDFVEIGIQAAVFYRISNPEKAVLTVGDASAIEKLVKETSTATLQVIVRSTALNQVAQSKAISVVPNHEDPPAPDEKAPLFFDMVHDEFISRLHDNFTKTYGLEIANIRVEAFKIMNSELADNISKQAIITAQTENKLANLEGQRQIATAEMERDSAVSIIKAQAASKQLATEVQAKNNAAISDAQSKAQAAKIVAQGEAEALLIKAEAESKAIELRAAAEKKRAVELGGTPLGSQLAVLSIQSEMVTKSMQGVSKVIYLPSNANMAQTPLQLFGMPGAGIPPLDGMEDDVKGYRQLKR
jgi:regulator of protease activity HflC (stomatin/prohibitin superfamily)